MSFENLPELSDGVFSIRVGSNETETAIGVGLLPADKDNAIAGLELLLEIHATQGASLFARFMSHLMEVEAVGFADAARGIVSLSDLDDTEMDGTLYTMEIQPGLSLEFFLLGRIQDIVGVIQGMSAEIPNLAPAYMEYLTEIDLGDEATITSLIEVLEAYAEQFVASQGRPNPGEISTLVGLGLGVALSGPEDIPSAEALSEALGCSVEEAEQARERIAAGLQEVMAEAEKEGAGLNTEPVSDVSDDEDIDWD